MNRFSISLLLGLFLLVVLSGCVTSNKDLNQDTNTVLVDTNNNINTVNQTESLISDFNADEIETELNSSLNDLNDLDSIFDDEELQ